MDELEKISEHARSTVIRTLSDPTLQALWTQLTARLLSDYLALPPRAVADSAEATAAQIRDPNSA